MTIFTIIPDIVVTIDEKLADYYAKKILEPLKRNESGVFFWLPGVGKSTCLHTIFSTPSLLKNQLGNLYARIRVVFVNCSLTEEQTAQSVLLSLPWQTKTQLVSMCTDEVDQGNEVLFVLDRLEVLNDDELKKLILNFSDVRSAVPGRIHLSIHSIQKPTFERLMLSEPRICSSVQRMDILPIQPVELIRSLLNEHVEPTGKIISETNGIMRLVKEYLRSGCESELFQTKRLSFWQRLPLEYREYYIKHNALHPDLRAFGFEKSAWLDHVAYIGLHRESTLHGMLSKSEERFFGYVKTRPNKLISKELVGELLWNEELEQRYSVWAVDQFVSRFRKKLLKVHIEPDRLKTVKGKGYIWVE